MSDIDSFRKVIGALEGSGKKDPKHKQVKEGLHAGDTAMGSVGLMPNTIQGIAERKSDPSELDDILAEANTGDIKDIMAENPHKYDEYTKELANKVLTKTGGDLPAAAAGWRYGDNLSKEAMQERLESNPGYKARIERAMQGGMSESEPTYLQKLLMPIPQDQLFSKIRKGIK